MKNVLSFLFFAALIGGVVWYENQPQTIRVPVETDDSYINDDYQPPSSTTPEVTQPYHSQVDYSDPDVTLEVRGVNGDDIDLKEVIGKPKRISQLGSEVRDMITSCPGVTDRDLVIRVDARLELKSTLPADVTVNYQTIGHPTVYDFSDGPGCDSIGVKHSLTPSRGSHITYWVALTGMVTPDHPNGDLSHLTTVIGAPALSLPNFQTMHFSVWGPKVVNCGNGPNEMSKVWLAGRTPVGLDNNWETNNCKPATTEQTAGGNS